MTKLLEAYRRKIDSFEVVEIADPQEIQRLRERRDVNARVDAHWSWNYGSEVEELRNLYEKGKRGQWNAETDIDWALPAGPDDWMLRPEASMLAQIAKLTGRDEATQKAAAFDEVAYTSSQLLHGEQAALQICGQLTNACERMDEKWYAASQVIDEARHVEVLSKFLQRKAGEIYPIGATLKFLLDVLLESEGVQKKTLGMQTLFEGMAVGIMDMLRGESQNALFSEILRRVEQDEARHAAFGVLMMRRIVGEANEAERASMEDWAFSILETLNANQQLDMLHYFAPKYGFEPEEVAKLMLGLPEFGAINSRPFMHTVIPNLRMLGLITTRSEEQWRDVGMLVESAPGVKGVPASA